MIPLRFVLAVLLIGMGMVVLARVVSLGIHPEIFPGVILGAAILALGVHRMSLVLRAWKATR
ncbi:MAG TPA: hypothetical protein VMS32_09900 [Verrucomicrobiae bacterium]|jgi:hypothetical protein|nr:hypothetical protein [Verrucomicrobiae bacterium]